MMIALDIAMLGQNPGPSYKVKGTHKTVEH